MAESQQSERATHPWERFKDRLDALPRFIAVAQPHDGIVQGKLDQQQPHMYTTVREVDLDEALDAELCGLCGGYGAANEKTHEPVPCIACGKHSEGMVLMALDPPRDELPPNSQHLGLHLIDGGE